MSSSTTSFEDLTNFARVHSGDMIIVTFSPTANGTPDVLRGTLRSGLITPEANSPYQGKQVFPRAGTQYAQIMCSQDGNNVSGQLNPAGAPSAEEERRLLHEFIVMAALHRETIDAAIATNVQNIQLAEQQRNNLDQRAQSADRERSVLSQRADSADNEMALLRQELVDARAQRQEFFDELTAARQDRAAFTARLASLEQRSGSPQAIPAPPTLPASTNDLNVIVQQLLRATSNQASPANEALATYLNPIAVSHGPGALPNISSSTTMALEAANFQVYRWSVNDTALAHRMRIVIAEQLQLHQQPWWPRTGIQVQRTPGARWRNTSS